MGSNVLLGSWVGSVGARGGNLGGWRWFGGMALRKGCPCSELFWSGFSLIRIEVLSRSTTREAPRMYHVHK